MRGMEETYGMGAGASVRKGKTAKQVKRARKNINLAKKTTTKVTTKATTKPEIRTNNAYGRKTYGDSRSPDTREAAKARSLRSAKELQRTVAIGYKIARNRKPSSNYRARDARGEKQ